MLQFQIFTNSIKTALNITVSPDQWTFSLLLLKSTIIQCAGGFRRLSRERANTVTDCLREFHLLSVYSDFFLQITWCPRMISSMLSFSHNFCTVSEPNSWPIPLFGSLSRFGLKPDLSGFVSGSDQTKSHAKEPTSKSSKGRWMSRIAYNNKSKEYKSWMHKSLILKEN